MRERLVTVALVGIHEGRCRYCRRRVLWATTQSKPGQRARTLPFDLPRPWPLRTERNNETGIEFEVWPAAAKHFATCRAPQQRSVQRETVYV